MIQQAQRLARLEDTFRVALMPDVHLGQQVPNGCVLATCERIYPEAIGRDIGCGLSAICFDIQSDTIPQSVLVSILAKLERLVPSLKQAKHLAARKLLDSCRAEQLSDPSLVRHANRDGLLQLGTLGFDCFSQGACRSTLGRIPCGLPKAERCHAGPVRFGSHQRYFKDGPQLQDFIDPTWDGS